MNKVVTPMAKLKDRFSTLIAFLTQNKLLKDDVVLNHKNEKHNEYTNYISKAVDADYIRILKLTDCDYKKYSVAFSFYGVNKETKDVLIYVNYKIIENDKPDVFENKILNFENFKNLLISFNKNIMLINNLNGGFINSHIFIEVFKTNFDFVKDAKQKELTNIKINLSKIVENNLIDDIKNFEKLNKTLAKNIEDFNTIDNSLKELSTHLNEKYKINDLQKQLTDARKKMNDEIKVFKDINHFDSKNTKFRQINSMLRTNLNAIRNNFNSKINSLTLDGKSKFEIKDKLLDKYKDFLVDKKI